jgi:hypothetical protein
VRLRNTFIIVSCTIALAASVFASSASAGLGRRPSGGGEAGKSVPQCSDGIDNDGDGLIDLGPDPGCTSPSDNSELDNLPSCSDGLDNDGDGLTDYPDDPGCSSPTDDLEGTAAATQCSDGRDNDRDGFIDYPADPGCYSTNDRTEKTH